MYFRIRFFLKEMKAENSEEDDTTTNSESIFSYINLKFDYEIPPWVKFVFSNIKILLSIVGIVVLYIVLFFLILYITIIVIYFSVSYFKPNFFKTKFTYI